MEELGLREQDAQDRQKRRKGPPKGYKVQARKKDYKATEIVWLKSLSISPLQPIL